MTAGNTFVFDYIWIIISTYDLYSISTM
jgi:hypothetical protein